MISADDMHISVNNRGGPEKYMVTGWVQIMNIEETHQGDFTCVAQNDVGMDSKTARVNIDRRGETIIIQSSRVTSYPVYNVSTVIMYLFPGPEST